MLVVRPGEHARTGPAQLGLACLRELVDTNVLVVS